MTIWLIDTSVAIPLVLESHNAHLATDHAIANRTVHLALHSALETYSVLTRLPGDARLDPADAALLLDERCGPVMTLTERASVGLIEELATLRIAGGAVYDAIIAITAREIDATLLTRDRRASATYVQLNVRVEMMA